MTWRQTEQLISLLKIFAMNEKVQEKKYLLKVFAMNEKVPEKKAASSGQERSSGFLLRWERLDMLY